MEDQTPRNGNARFPVDVVCEKLQIGRFELCHRILSEKGPNKVYAVPSELGRRYTLEKPPEKEMLTFFRAPTAVLPMEREDDQPDTLTVPQAAQVSGLSTRVIEKLVSDGKLGDAVTTPSGKKRRILAGGLANFLNSDSEAASGTDGA